ncbi:hypothetical protein [Oceanobacillus sp. CFH 90083]|uniref:hypothetical protein n=1 Tax=Oceanobacillus sp. CFH 90083 TaxID=2592336 RepID=UPI001883AAF4|nr:hypothetical protein [Oceanobacillus sp. CFH 90083]
MLNRYLMIAFIIFFLPMTQLFSGTHHSYVLTEQNMLVDNHASQDLGIGGNDQSDKFKLFIVHPTLVITLFLLGSLCLFATVVRTNRTKQLLTPVFYQSNFVI